MSKGAEVDSSMSERPEHQRPRRLADWLNPTGERKVHSLIDKVYKRKNLEMAWGRVKANRGAGGVDGQSIDDFAEVREEQLDRLHEDLRDDAYRPQPVRQKRIPKAGKPGAHRELGIPTVYDRVCQQALLNRLEPIFEPVFDDASFGYRRGRSQHDALRKVWKELESGCEWVVDGDLSDFFGTVDHDKLLTLVAQRVSDGRVLRLIRSMLKAGSYGDGRLFPTERGTPQGGVATPRTQKVTSRVRGVVGVVVRSATVRWRCPRGHGNAVADHDRVVIDEDLFDDEAHDSLPLHDVERRGRRAQAREKRRQGLGQAQMGGALANLLDQCVQLVA